MEQNGPFLQQLIEEAGLKHIQMDLFQIAQLDSTGLAFLVHLQRLMAKKGIQIEWVNLPPSVQAGLKLMAASQKKPLRSDSPRESFLEQLGEEVYHLVVEDFGQFFLLLANMSIWGLTDLFTHRWRRKGEVLRQAVLIGVNALPVVLSIAFLIGAVLAIQAAEQLRQFGANLFITDLVVISMTREMGPLVTAILVAGRSGSAIASEIATMVVSEEMDALRTMGVNPVRYVAIPKLYAGLATMPALTILANILGITGGMLIAYLSLDLSVNVFMERMQQVLYFRDLLTGFIKSLVFVGLIVITSSYYGLRVRGGAVGVGQATTAAVVASIFLV
ncbi:MAG: MlaE family lipid ABC transporter permease subunit, partial [Calditrichaeota bacterium]